MDLNNLKRDGARIEAGEWVTDIPGCGDLRLRVRGMSSKTVVALRARKERNVPRNERERDGTLKPEAAMRVFGEVLHEAVLLEWDCLDIDGEPLPYDSDKALTLLTDEAFMSFADAVVWASQVVDRNTGAAQEDLEKNSQRSSAGSSSGAKKPTA